MGAAGRTRALDAVSVALPEGEILAVVGLNGAGKSTLLRAFSGLLALIEGELWCGGERFDRDNLEQRRKILFIPDRPFLAPHSSISENVAIYLETYRSEAGADRVAELLDEFDLLTNSNTPCDRLSRGQAYKVGMVALAAIRPDIWLLDEPFASGMDGAGIQSFRQHARAAADSGASVAFTTQLVSLARDFADRIAFMHEGKLVALVEPDGVENAAMEHPELQRLIGN